MGLAVITGANRGIGLELSRQLAARGETVIAACRHSSPELASLDVQVEADVDVADAASLATFAKRLEGKTIDLLVNNAGIGEFGGLDRLDFASVQRQFEVNAMGPLRVTTTLLPNLKRGSKVAIITSRMGSIADNGSGGSYGYRMSKAAVNAAGASLALDLKDKGIPVLLLHPGMVSTEMTGGQGIPTRESVTGLLKRIDALTLDATGQFQHAVTGEALPW